MCYSINTTDDIGKITTSRICEENDRLIVKEYLTTSLGESGNSGIWFYSCGYGSNDKGPKLFYCQVATCRGYRQAYASTLEEAVAKYTTLKKKEWVDHGFFLTTNPERIGANILDFFGQ